MTDLPVALFDFSAFAGDTASYLSTIKEFAAGHAFRSAAVDELLLDDDFYRRPLRPEDFGFIRFQQPVQSATVSRLPSLASQRTLLTLNELSSSALPTERDPQRLAAFAEFANNGNRVHATRLAPFLEAFAFDYLGNLLPGEFPSSYAARLGRIYSDEYQFWIGLFNRLIANNYLQEGLRFILVQRWCLAPTKRRVLAEAAARGNFESWPAGAAPSLASKVLGDAAFRRIASTLGVARSEHSYWQFYLPTSLAKCNLLYALGRLPERTLALGGALYVAQAEWLAFEAAIAQCCPHLMKGISIERSNPEQHVSELMRHVESVVQFLEQQGKDSAIRLGQGLAAAGKLAERARWDLGEQLQWLSTIERYRVHAETISRRIETECPDIDRETFVEPRDMCSTTHVHDDHRLVTVETGIMHFWGNLDMRLEMNPGEKVLIPEGRLHGSTVLSPECVYHQPIIPDEWVQSLLRQAPTGASSTRTTKPAVLA